MSEMSSCEVGATIENQGPEESKDTHEESDSVNNTTEQSSIYEEPSPYDYLKRDEFTSERFKVEIRKIHRQLGVKQLKKKMAYEGVTAHKVKILNWGAYVTFMSAEERDKAISKMNGLMWKGKALEVSIAKPRADPGFQNAKRPAPNETECGVKRARRGPEQDEVPSFERLKAAVTPLADTPYEAQLQTKGESIRKLMLGLYGRILHLNPLLESHLKPQKDEASNKQLLCQLHPIKPSPVVANYRNKCEFTIGRDLDGNDRIVGFRLGKHKGGHSCVGSPEGLKLMSPPIEAVREALQLFLKENFTKFVAYDSMTYTGFWRTATVRSTKSGDTMLALEVLGDSWDDAEPTEARAAAVAFFSSAECSSLRLQSLQFVVRRRTGDPITPDNCRIVCGGSAIVEECLEFKFRISLGAFFQINTLAAEVLYSHVRSLCHGGEDVVVLDLCCGTGTIGLCVAKTVHKVIGIEMCAEAVEDAKENVKMNGVDNVELICGKVEDALPSAISSIDSSKDIVAILDPPRAGVHGSVIAALRKCQHVSAIVYVSCNPEAATANFMDLARPESNRIRGAAFVAVEATPVDLFPQTRHVELVMLWRRVSS